MGHSNVSEEARADIERARANIDVIGSSGLLVSMSFQGIDFEWAPWLREAIAQYPSIDMLNATWSHSILDMISSQQALWEVRQRVSDSRVTFFSEYASPNADLIPDVFFVLAPHSFSYSTGYEREEQAAALLDPQLGPDLMGVKAIRTRGNGKLGIVMYDFESILNNKDAGFFAYQRDLGKLEAHMDLLKRKLDTTEGITSFPIDLESCFVGSAEPLEVWPRYLDALRKHDLDQYFLPIEEVIQEAEGLAIEAPAPKRILGTKWTKHVVQLKYAAQNINTWAYNEYEHRLMGVAGVSDWYSGICTKIDSSRRKTILSAKRVDGSDSSLEIGYNQPLIDVAHAALDLVNKRHSYLRGESKDRPLPFDKYLAEKLDSSTFTVRRMIEVARNWRNFDDAAFGK
ncbi:MAG: hypothetical protein AAB400_02800 [Patescibacteria group bacterium]